jgi:hypothetical protein
MPSPAPTDELVRKGRYDTMSGRAGDSEIVTLGVMLRGRAGEPGRKKLYEELFKTKRAGDRCADAARPIEDAAKAIRLAL